LVYFTHIEWACPIEKVRASLSKAGGAQVLITWSQMFFPFT